MSKPAESDELAGSAACVEQAQGDEFPINRRNSIRFLDDVRHVELQLLIRAEVCDESMGGIGLEFAENPHLHPGQIVDIQYRGQPMQSEVRWTQETKSGYRVGLAWK